MKTEEKIRLNIEAHDRIAAKYEKIHGEIFNTVEQARIHSAIEQVVEAVKGSNKALRALDVGCGSGNLTRHLIDSGIYTVSADVSEKFLKLVERAFSSTGLSKTIKINGQDLANVEDCTCCWEGQTNVIDRWEPITGVARDCSFSIELSTGVTTINLKLTIGGQMTLFTVRINER